MAEELGISLHALTGISVDNTMQLQVTIAGERLIALVDSGSTHTSVCDSVAQRLQLAISPRPGLSVKVANGDQVPSAGVCLNTSVQIAEETFTMNCYTLLIAGFDVVLGVQWLRTLGPILWDFESLSMAFCRNGQTVRLTGIGAPTKICTAIGSTRDLMDALLDSFQDLFAEPRGLPPHRRYDHLLPGAAPVAVRPYRYPQLLKDEIERQCDEMLALGIIRESTSPFSSPVLLVRKADKTWRFCVDYRELNLMTVRDKFPIPLVDELIDQLKGARFFTKLDLRSGYHQVRMHPDDVYMTAFRTHRGHFEFMVMPFGLSNAPSTFQALMNEILKPFIRKFVLVFFDDILVFSSSWAQHLQHVREVFEALCANHLALKRSKCSFGEKSVASLGNVIGANSVAMDRSKVEAVEAWPRPRTVKVLRGFLGLTGYYRKFVRGYGAIAAPLTALLKKESFSWTPEAGSAFAVLKQALISAPVLQLLDFTKLFVVDCDASGSGFGAVLHQGDGVVAFFSRANCTAPRQVADLRA